MMLMQPKQQPAKQKIVQAFAEMNLQSPLIDANQRAFAAPELFSPEQKDDCDRFRNDNDFRSDSENQFCDDSDSSNFVEYHNVDDILHRCGCVWFLEERLSPTVVSDEYGRLVIF